MEATSRVERARARGRAHRHDPVPWPSGQRRRRRLVMGDPQAPFTKVLSLLDHRGLLSDDGALVEEVELTSIGDHFDFGGRHQRAEAREDGLDLLGWLASHPPDQVRLIAGNHDLARVGELAHFDEASFARAQAAADRIYPHTEPAAEAQFLAQHPELPTAECIARDFSAFAVEQRAQVTALLRAGRFHLALADGPDRLILHAGLTAAQVELLGLAPGTGAEELAERLNQRLRQAVSTWTGGRLELPGLHRHGDARGGEGGGLLYHRPSHPGRSAPALFQGALARRFDPRGLPPGLTQVIGHIRDKKCRQLLGDWADEAPAADGPLRHLFTDGTHVHYAHGVPPPPPGAAALYFTDGGMLHAEVPDYQLLDLDQWTAG